MKMIAINGSPRKNGNTGTLLKSALEGAESEGAQTEIIHLYDLTYKGCISCFACKLTGGKSYGKCALQDDLTPVFEKIKQADALVIGSPVYLSDVTGALRSFLERLMFPYLVYSKTKDSLLGKTIPSAFIYTMNVDEETAHKLGYENHFKNTENNMSVIFGPSQSLYVTDTKQFNDYSKYVNHLFDPEKKEQRHEEVFPQDCKKAFELGKKLEQSKKANT
jgi:multimeric flavodoxin WrbA